MTSGRIFGIAHGGEDRFTKSFGNWLANENHKATLVGIDSAGLRVRHLSYGIEIKPAARNQNKRAIGGYLSFRLFLAFRYLSYSLRMIIWMVQVLRILSINLRSEITLINAQDSGYTGLAAIVAAKILGVPAIISLHGIRYKDIESNPFLNKATKKIVLLVEKRLDKFTLRNADLVTVVSPSLIEYVNQMAPEKPVQIFPVAIKSKNFDYSETSRIFVRSQLGINDDAIVIGYIGRLSHEKNLFMLMESFANASLDHPQLMLVLVGHGMLEFELRKKADELNIQGKVIFCGVREDIGAILSSFDIFVLPSFIEGLSNALLEAMTCGKAIICSDIEGNRQLITNNVEGILIDPTDPKSLTLTIQLLSKDDLLRQELGKNAKIKAHQHTEEIVYPKIVHQYLAMSQYRN